MFDRFLQFLSVLTFMLLISAGKSAPVIVTRSVFLSL